MSAPRRVSLITGAAQGLGRAIALRLAKDGHHVGLNDLPSKRANLEDVANLAEKNGVRAAVFAGDVSKESDVQTIVDGAADALGGLHVVYLSILSLEAVLHLIFLADGRERRHLEASTLSRRCFFTASFILATS